MRVVCAVTVVLTVLLLGGCTLGEPPPTPTPIPPTSTPVPTDTPVLPTPTPANTATPTDTPLPPTETPVPTPTVEIYQLLAQNHFQAAIRTTAVVGVFRYNDKYTPINPPVTVDLLDADGKIVASEEAFVSPWVVRPGGLIPFRAIFHDPPSNWQSYKFTVEFGEMSDFFRRSYSTAMEVVESTLAQQTDLGYGPKIVGTVMNTGPADFHMQQIIGVLWDAEGNLLDVTTGHTTLGGLAAGQKERFEVEFNNGKGGARFDLLVAGYLSK